MIISETAELIENHNSNLTETTQRDRVAVLLAGYGEVESFRELSLYNQAATTAYSGIKGYNNST